MILLDASGLIALLSGEPAAEVRARHYRKKTTELSLADCSFIAASMSGDTIVTKDAAVIRVAASEGLDAVNLR